MLYKSENRESTRCRLVLTSHIQGPRNLSMWQSLLFYDTYDWWWYSRLTQYTYNCWLTTPKKCAFTVGTQLCPIAENIWHLQSIAINWMPAPHMGVFKTAIKKSLRTCPNSAQSQRKIHRLPWQRNTGRNGDLGTGHCKRVHRIYSEMEPRI